MDAALNWVWQGSVVAVALALMLRLLERARASVRSALCWAALLLVILLPAVSWIAAQAPRPAALTSFSDAIVAVPDTWWTSAAVMVAAWAAWALVQTIRFVGAVLALRRARASLRPFPADVEARLPYWSRLRNGGRSATLALSDSVSAAAVLGGGRPVIAVAPSLVASFDADEIDRVLVHEWAHVQRRDDLVQLLQVSLRIIAGWHPAVWWIDRRLHLEREVACDEATVAMTGSPKSYAACLVKLAGLRGGDNTPLAAPAIFRSPGLRARIIKILSGRGFIHPAWSRGIAAAVVSTLCAVSVAVAGIQLVEPSVRVVPIEAIPLLAGHSSAGASPAFSPAAVHVASQTVVRVAPPGSRKASVPAEPEPKPASARTTQAPPSAADQGGPAPHPAAIESPPASVPETAGGPETSAAHAAPPTAPAEPTPPPDKSPWAAAAEGGTALGRSSRNAGVATGGFFTRFAKRVAGSF